MTVLETIQAIWQSFLDFISMFVIPDWGALIQLLPVFLVLFVLGPILSLGALVWLVYFLRKPRAPLASDPEPVAAPIGACWPRMCSRRAVGPLPEVRGRPASVDLDLRQLRARPEDPAPGPGRPARPAAARRRSGCLSATIPRY